MVVFERRQPLLHAATSTRALEGTGLPRSIPRLGAASEDVGNVGQGARLSVPTVRKYLKMIDQE